jgi:hypothetical protein
MTTVKPLVWSEPAPSDRGKTSWYDHVFAETPFGRIMIEWKSWKDDGPYDGHRDSRDVRTPWEFYDGTAYELEDAKRIAQEEFAKRVNECLQGD